MDMKNWTYVVGMILGAFVLISVCVVWLRHQKLGGGGTGLSVIGIVLVGLSIWSSVKLQVGDVRVELETLRARVQQVADAGAKISEETARVAESTAGNRDAILNLTQELGQRQMLAPEQMRSLHEILQRTPTVQPEVLRQISRDLSSDGIKRKVR